LATPGFSERVEFVNASDDVIRQLFVTERIADRAGGDLLMPPPAHRRTFKQIKDWFEMGNGQRREAAAAAADVTVIHSRDDETIYWNGAWRDRPPRLPSDEVTCSGINRSFVYGLGGHYTDEQRRVLDDGLCHTFREGMALYLKDDKSIKMHQRRHGTDVCEHTFSDVRSSNPKPNMQQAREGLSHATSAGQMGGGRDFRVRDRGNSGTATRQEDYDMMMEPMKKKRK